MDQVVRSLQSVAMSPGDTRRAAAWMELAICHACSISRSSESGFPKDSAAVALSSLLHAADLGDVWAQAVVQRVSQAIRVEIPACYDVRSWLFNAGTNGSRIALESLMDLDQAQGKKALKIYRTTFCGNPQKIYSSIEVKLDYLRNPGHIINARQDTVLHWVASTGNSAMFEAFPSSSLTALIVNSKNEQGDTPILCATRAGHFDILTMLISLNADASLINSFSENALHFLTNLDNDDIPTAAELLVGAGAELDAEATGYSGNTYLEPRPRGKSCPRLRAIFVNNAHALRTLMDLTTNATPMNMAFQCIPLSSQKHMLAWAIRLHNFEILEVLEKHCQNTPLFNAFSEIYVWNSGRRYSLTELCVLGCVSANPASGFDVPEQFFRMLNHGKDFTRSLETSLQFLSLHDPSVLSSPCGGARNALFYAIKVGRSDAVRFLSSHEQLPGLENLFNSPYSRFARCKEMESLLNSYDEHSRPLTVPVSKKTRRQQHIAAARRQRRARSPLFTSTPPPTEASDDSYENPDSDSDSNSNSNVGEDDPNPTTLKQHSVADYTPGYMGIGDSPSDADGRDNSLPFNYQKLEGVVDAVLMSILYGRRKIFCDLVTGIAKNTILPPTQLSCFVAADYGPQVYYDNNSVENTVNSHTPDNLLRHFPVQVWSSFVTINNPTRKFFEPFDGIIHYPLLYMTVIAKAIHRDIFLAKTLLSVMHDMNVPEPKEWTVGSRFESICLAIDSLGPITPLFHSGYSRWDELSILLMEHGASLQARCGTNPGPSQTVLSRLYHRTEEAKSEVLNLLSIASSLNMDRIITLHDVDMLLGSYAKPRGLVKWEDNILCWDSYYQSPPISYIHLWSTIQNANASQCQKIRADPKLSLIMNAVRRRDIVATQHLLDFGLNVNERIEHRSFFTFYVRATALDVVSWTATLSSARCSDSGHQLKERDAQIADLLISRGAIRGPDYIYEYLISMSILEWFLIPVVCPVILGSLIYLFGSKAFKLTEQSWNIRDKIFVGDPPEATVSNWNIALHAWGWFFDFCCPLGTWMFWDYITERRNEGYEKVITTKAVTYLSALFTAAIANFVARSIIASGGRAAEAFGLDILVDLCVFVIYLCAGAMSCMPSLIICSFLLSHTRMICEDIQEDSPSDVLWAASRSVLGPRISRWRTGAVNRYTELRDWLYFNVRMPLLRRRGHIAIDEWEFEAGTMYIDDFSDVD